MALLTQNARVAGMNCWPLLRRYGCLTVLLGLLSWPASAQVSREPQLKAVFLFNFAQFTEWPTNALPPVGEPFVIGILGSDPFSHYLDDTVKNEKIRDRPVVVRRYTRLEEIDTCHILYVGLSEAGRLEQIMTRLKEKPVLTVSDVPSANSRGVMIRFVTDKNKLRFQVNVEAARRAGLTLSSKLLRLAEGVGRTE